MSLFTNTADKIWRQYIVDGNPGSGVYNTKRPEIIVWGGIVEANLDAHDDAIAALETYIYPSLKVESAADSALVLSNTNAGVRDTRIRNQGNALTISWATDAATWSTFYKYDGTNGHTWYDDSATVLMQVNQSGEVSGSALASQAEAEGGADNDKLMTPLRTKQLINKSGVTGMISIWPTATPPSGYLECDGSAVSRTTYAALFAVIGTSFGSGDGSTTFNLPDLRGEFVRGWDNGRGADSGRSLGSTQSAQNAAHTHTIDPPATTTSSSGNHRHEVGPYLAQLGGGGGGYNFQNSGSGTFYTEYAGSHTHSVNIPAFQSNSQGGNEARPRNVALMYVIKT